MVKIARYLTMSASSVPRSLHIHTKRTSNYSLATKNVGKKMRSGAGLRQPRTETVWTRIHAFFNFRVHCIEIAEALDNRKRNISHLWRRAEHGDSEQTPNDDTKTQKKKIDYLVVAVRCAKSTRRAIFATSECKNLNLVQSCLLFHMPCRLYDFFPFDCLNNTISFFCAPQHSNTRSTIFCVSGRSANEILVILFALLSIFFFQVNELASTFVCRPSDVGKMKGEKISFININRNKWKKEGG